MEEEQTATEQTSDTLLDQAEPTLGEGEFFLSDGIKGNGDMPDWYNSNKYKSISEQAKAYSDLEKKFGGFTGAPKDGYESPEGIESDDALLSELNEFAAKTNMSQDAYNDAWQLLSAQDQAVNAVNQEDELAKLGDNAHTRIKTVEGFMKNNLSPEVYEEARELVTDANSIKLVEMLVKATSPVKLPIDGGPLSGLQIADFNQDSYDDLLLVSGDLNVLTLTYGSIEGFLETSEYFTLEQENTTNAQVFSVLPVVSQGIYTCLLYTSPSPRDS